jgi:flagellum-specific peptidoglycan hydrolase FlgJ
MSRWSWRILIGGGVFLLARAAFGGMRATTGEKAPVTEDKRLKFVSDLWNAISRVWPESSTASRQLIISHSAYESGYGVGTAYRLGNNIANITKGSSNIPSIDGPDTDCSSGTCVPITQKFRAYATVDDSVSDYLAFLQSSRYANAYALLVAGDVGFARALGEAGYYTQAIETYVSNFRGVLAGVQKRLAALQLVA